MPIPAIPPIVRGPATGAYGPRPQTASRPPTPRQSIGLPNHRALRSRHNRAGGGQSRPEAAVRRPDIRIGRIPLFDTLRGRHLLLPFKAANGITKVILRDPPQPGFKRAGLFGSKGGNLQKSLQVGDLHHIPGFDQRLPGSPDFQICFHSRPEPCQEHAETVRIAFDRALNQRRNFRFVDWLRCHEFQDSPAAIVLPFPGNTRMGVYPAAALSHEGGERCSAVAVAERTLELKRPIGSSLSTGRPT
jgi:hypothetical protein